MIHVFEYLTHFIISRDRASYVDDFVDRLNRKYTVIILLVFLTVISSKQYVGDPLACFCPAHFTGAHVEYTNNICWISKAYYVPIDTPFTRASSMSMFPSYSSASDSSSSSSSSSSSDNTAADNSNSNLLLNSNLNLNLNAGGFGTFGGGNMRFQGAVPAAAQPAPPVAQAFSASDSDASSSDGGSVPASIAALFASLSFNSHHHVEPVTLDSFQYPHRSNSSHMKFARVDNLIAYYPFLLLAQAIVFYIPYFCWKNIVNRSAYDIGTLVYLARDSQYTETQLHREKLLRYLIRHIDRANNYYSSLKRLRKQNKIPSASTTTSSASTPTYNQQHQQQHNKSSSEFDVINMESEEDEQQKQKNSNRISKSVGLFKSFKLSNLLRTLNIFNSKEVEQQSETAARKAKLYEKEAYHRPQKHRNEKLMKEGDGSGGSEELNNLNSATNNGNNSYTNNYLYNYDENDFYDEDTGETKAHSYIISNYLPSIQYFFYARILFSIYMLIKVVYIVNCLGQFLLINKFIAGKSQSTIIYNQNNSYVRSDLTYLTSGSIWKGFEFGYRSLASLIETGSFFGDSSHLIIFHTVVFCDFRIRMLGNHLHRHTVQCVLPINIFSEKVFTLLWFWLFILNIINIYNFIHWLFYFFSFSVRENFIKKHIFLTNTTRYVSPTGKADTVLLKSSDHHHHHHHHHKSTTTTTKYSPTTPSPMTAATIRATFLTKQNTVQSQMQYQQQQQQQQKQPSAPSPPILNDRHHHLHRQYSFAAAESGAVPQTSKMASMPSSTAPQQQQSTPPYQHAAQQMMLNSNNYEIRNELNAKLIHNMTKYYLMHDNIFILKLISCNSNELITRELINLILENYKRKCQLFDNDKTI